MKVYELITELLKRPAGADVQVVTTMTMSDLTGFETIDEDDTGKYYRVQATIDDVCHDGDNIVTLYV